MENGGGFLKRVMSIVWGILVQQEIGLAPSSAFFAVCFALFFASLFG